MTSAQPEAGPAEALGRFLAPRSVAVLGASRRSPWTRLVLDNLTTASPGCREIYLVAHRPEEWEEAAEAEDRLRIVTSIDRLPHGVDSAICVSRAETLEDTFRRCADRGTAGMVALASGFAEAGADGVRRQSALARHAAASGTRLLGPNSVGFINPHDGVRALIAHQAAVPGAGHVGVVSQSGAMTRAILDLLAARDCGLSLAVSCGNEADVDSANLIDVMVAQRRTRAICLYLETIRHPARFAEAAARAAEARVPLVMLRAGRGQRGQRLAAAHTGALATDSALTAGALRQLGIVEVSSLEELTATAAFLTRQGPVTGSKIFFVSGSGGRCNLIADACESLGIPLHDVHLSADVAATAKLTGAPAAKADDEEQVVLTNPYDATGSFVSDATVFPAVLRAIMDSGQADHVVLGMDLPAEDSAVTQRLQDTFTAGLATAASTGSMLHFMASTALPPTAAQRRFAASAGIGHVLPGVDLGLRVLRGALEWSRRVTALAPVTPDRSRAPILSRAPAPDLSEFQARELVAAHGVPVVPARLVRTLAEARLAVTELGPAVAVKASSPAIAHKAAVGALALDVGPENVAEVFARIWEQAEKVAGADRLDGLLVAPMRPAGLELFVGALRHPQWGACLGVHLGGSGVEDQGFAPSWRLLPLGEDGVRDLIGEFAAQDHVRVHPLARRLADDDVIAVFTRFAEAAEKILAKYGVVEINPVLIGADHIEALDVWIEPYGPDDRDSLTEER